MDINSIIRPSVGADLSRPPPIYRPVMPDDVHDRIKYATSSIAPQGWGGHARGRDKLVLEWNEGSSPYENHPEGRTALLVCTLRCL